MTNCSGGKKILKQIIKHQGEVFKEMLKFKKLSLEACVLEYKNHYPQLKQSASVV